MPFLLLTNLASDLCKVDCCVNPHNLLLYHLIMYPSILETHKLPLDDTL